MRCKEQYWKILVYFPFQRMITSSLSTFGKNSTLTQTAVIQVGVANFGYGVDLQIGVENFLIRGY